MKFLRLKTTDPYYNLAVEEYLFSHTIDDVFMLWQNDKTVVIGRNQNAYAELDLDFARENGIKIARRITGGGAVYHDLGNLNYSYISAQKGQNEIDFAAFCAPIVSVLNSLGVDAVLSGRNDLMVSDKKISGNAQHSSGGRVLHHGTLLYDSDLTVLSKVLRADPLKLKAKAIRSVSSRVMNLKEILPLDNGVDALSDVIFNELMASCGGEELADAPSCEEIDALAARNVSNDWIFPRKPFLSRYSVKNKKRYEFGTVEIEMQMSENTLEGISISGDFFGNLPISQLEDHLKGAYRREIAGRLSNISLDGYIFGMTASELAELIERAFL